MKQIGIRPSIWAAVHSPEMLDAGFDGLVPELRVSNNVIDRMVG